MLVERTGRGANRTTRQASEGWGGKSGPVRGALRGRKGGRRHRGVRAKRARNLSGEIAIHELLERTEKIKQI